MWQLFYVRYLNVGCRGAHITPQKKKEEEKMKKKKKKKKKYCDIRLELAGYIKVLCSGCD